MSERAPQPKDVKNTGPQAHPRQAGQPAPALPTAAAQAAGLEPAALEAGVLARLISKIERM